MRSGRQDSRADNFERTNHIYLCIRLVCIPKVNTFIESKNLKLSKAKCHKMHLGKEKITCPVLKVHGENMEMSTEEKYLGDILMNNGKMQKTIDDRRSKGFGMVIIINCLFYKHMVRDSY